MTWLIDFIQKHKSNTGWRKWFFGGLVLLAAVAVVAIYYVRSYFKNKELARLKHEKAVAEEEAHHAQVVLAVAHNEEELKKRLAEVRRSREVVAALEEKIDQLKLTRLAEEDLINSIKSWDDVDAKVK